VVVEASGSKEAEVGAYGLKAVGPGRGGEVEGGFRGGADINVDCVESAVRGTLRRQKGYHSRACPYIESQPVVFTYGHGRTQHYRISANLQGGCLVADGELSESEFAHQMKAPSFITKALSHSAASSESCVTITVV